MLDRPIGEVQSPPLPTVGVGEPVARVVELLDQGPAVVVLDGGRVLFDGVDVTNRPPQKRGIGYVFQDYAIYGANSRVGWTPDAQESFYLDTMKVR